jgi:type VI secretion system protein VasD
MFSNHITYILVPIFFLLSLSACTTTGKLAAKVWKPYANITVNASDDVNPDKSGRPSPIQVKIYELNSRSTLDNLDFDRAFYSAKTLLSDELVSQHEITLQPGESLKHKVELNKTSKFIAVTASFIDIDNARWKHIYPIKSHGHYNLHINLADKEIQSTDSSKAKDKQPKQEKKSKPSISKENLQKGADNLKQANETKQSAQGLLSK